MGTSTILVRVFSGGREHVRHIYEKCGVHSRAELIALLDRVRQG